MALRQAGVSAARLLLRCGAALYPGQPGAARWLASQPAAREQLSYDVCVVGAGPAGLSAAIRFKQLCAEDGKDLSVCVLEKGSEPGAHILSGNVFETTALDELFPKWQERRASSEPGFADLPLRQPVTQDKFYYLTQQSSVRLPTPPQMRNRKRGSFVASLSELTRWLAARAEELGVDVLPGFAGKEVLQDWHGAVVGVATSDQGVGRDGQPKPTYAPGVDLLARLTLFAEGCRGSLSESLIQHYNLRAGVCPQTYALGIKEVWEVPEGAAQPGLVIHTVGAPLDARTYGGGWMYHMDERRVSLGLVVGLDYANPHLSPFQEFQAFKRHPLVAAAIAGGSCLQYGARTLNEGGLQSIPQLVFPGGALIGCAAGFLNVPKIKGTHTAMKSGMLAGEEAFRALVLQDEARLPDSQHKAGRILLNNYPARLEASWVYAELGRERNIRPGFSKWGLWGGMANAALTTYLTRGKEPWTLKTRRPDHEALRPAAECAAPDYPAPDGQTTFDIPTSLHRSGTNHEHDQPSHLLLRDAGLPAAVNLPTYGGPEARVCPAGVYEYSAPAGPGQQPRLLIHAQNCLHCKACSVKDPRQNIQWTVPEGGGGPAYSLM